MTFTQETSPLGVWGSRKTPCVPHRGSFREYGHSTSGRRLLVGRSLLTEPIRRVDPIHRPEGPPQSAGVPCVSTSLGRVRTRSRERPSTCVPYGKDPYLAQEHRLRLPTGTGVSSPCVFRVIYQGGLRDWWPVYPQGRPHGTRRESLTQIKDLDDIVSWSLIHRSLVCDTRECQDVWASDSRSPPVPTEEDSETPSETGVGEVQTTTTGRNREEPEGTAKSH